MKILITGASGFIGQHLLEMINFKLFQVNILTRDVNKKQRVSRDEINIVKGDLNDLSSLVSATENIDCIINIAAEVRHQSRLAITNIQGVKNLMEACTINSVSKVIHISSVGVVGKQYNFKHQLIDEICYPTPQNQYEITKLESEKIIKEVSEEKNIKTIILRPTNVFGEYHPYNAILSLINFIKKYKFIFTTRDARLNYVYVKDLCAVILECISQDEYDGDVINVGASDKFDDFILNLSKILNIKLKVIYLPIFLIKFLEFIKLNKFRSVSNGIEYDSSKFKKIQSKFEFDSIGNTVKFFIDKKMIK